MMIVSPALVRKGDLNMKCNRKIVLLLSVLSIYSLIVTFHTVFIGHTKASYTYSTSVEVNVESKVWLPNEEVTDSEKKPETVNKHEKENQQEKEKQEDEKVPKEDKQQQVEQKEVTEEEKNVDVEQNQEELTEEEEIIDEKPSSKDEIEQTLDVEEVE